MSADDKTIEVLLLRQQLLIMRRHQKRGPSISQGEKFILITLVEGVCCVGHAQKARLEQLVLIFKPDTLLAWHRRLVKWKWTYKNIPGRPSTKDAVKRLIVQMKTENRLWGIPRIEGELLKLGIKIARSTIRAILRQNGFDPAGTAPSVGWWEFIGRHKQAWACDFFTIETAFLKTFYVFVVIEINSRTMVGIRVISRPTQEWVENTLINMMGFESPGILIHDGDGIFSGEFDKRMRVYFNYVAKTPPYSPMANAYVERLIGSVRRECTDHHLFFSERHLQETLNVYREYYESHRPHQGIDQKVPAIPTTAAEWPTGGTSEIKKTGFFAGLHHSYRLAG